LRPRIVIYGAGGHGKVVADVVEKQGTYELVGFVDDAPKDKVLGIPVLGTCADLESLRGRGVEHAISAVGDAGVREMTDDRLLAAGFTLCTAIHPSAQIARAATIGEGSVVMPGAVVGPDAVLGRSCIINTCASVDHDCLLGSYVHVAPGAHLCGGVHVGSHSLVGAGASALPGTHVGEKVTVAAGVVVAGSPARVLSRKEGR
jgi:sugar O-acyltransferase (sialic acid O-acetyltransferase NeuD family)